MKQQDSGLLGFGVAPKFSNIYCDLVVPPACPSSSWCTELLLYCCWLLVSLCHQPAPLSSTCLPLIHLLSNETMMDNKLSAHNSYFNPYNFCLQLTFTYSFLCPLVYLPLPLASQREIHTLALLPAKPSHFKIGWNGNSSAE